MIKLNDKENDNIFDWDFSCKLKLWIAKLLSNFFNPYIRFTFYGQNVRHISPANPTIDFSSFKIAVREEGTEMTFTGEIADLPAEKKNKKMIISKGMSP